MLYTKNLRNISKIPFILRIPAQEPTRPAPARPAPARPGAGRPAHEPTRPAHEPTRPAPAPLPLPLPVPLPLPAPVPVPLPLANEPCIGERQYALTIEELKTLGKW